MNAFKPTHKTLKDWIAQLRREIKRLENADKAGFRSADISAGIKRRKEKIAQMEKQIKEAR